MHNLLFLNQLIPMLHFRKRLRLVIICWIIIFIFKQVCASAATPGTFKWEFVMEGNMQYRSPVIDDSGTIYTITDGYADGHSFSNLYAIDAEGNQKWVIEIEDSFFLHLVIGTDGTLFTSDNKDNFYAIKSDGSKELVKHFEEGIGAIYAVDNDNTLYAKMSFYYCTIKPSGSINCIYAASIDSSVLTIGPGCIYVDFFMDGYFRSINNDGSSRWEFNPVSTAIDSLPAIGSDGTLYVSGRKLSSGGLFAVNPDGTEKWFFDTVFSSDYHSPVIGADGTIYTGSKALYAINPDGTEKWKFDLESSAVSSPAVGADGTIYILSFLALHAINSDGIEKWKYDFDYISPASLSIVADGTVYVSAGKKIYAIHSDSGGLADSPWPKDIRDNRNSRCADTSSPTAAKPAVTITGPDIAEIGETITLTATTGDGSDSAYWWWTSNAAVATVSNGKVTAFAPGAVTISAMGNKSFVTNTKEIAVNGPCTFKWKFKTNGKIHSSPAIDMDGVIYVGSNDGNLYAVNPDGSQKWAFATQGSVDAVNPDGSQKWTFAAQNFVSTVNQDGSQKWVFAMQGSVDSSPSIGTDGTIYIGDYGDTGNTPFGNLYAINPDGSRKWVFKTGDYVKSSPSVATDGTVYLGCDDRNLYAINPDGSQKWVFATEGAVNSSPAISDEGTIYVGDYGTTRTAYDYVSYRYIYAINPDGSPKWITDKKSILSSPAIGADGALFFNSYAINPDGTEKWNESFRGVNHYSSFDPSPAINPEGIIYAGGVSKEQFRTTYGFVLDSLYAINSDGSLEWEFETNNGINTSPAIGADGTIYVGVSDEYFPRTIHTGRYENRLIAINPDGSLKWEFYTEGEMYSSPAIGEDGTIYFGSYDGNLYAIQDDCGGLADSPWPKFHRDNRNTGNSEISISISGDDTIIVGSAINLTAQTQNAKDSAYLWSSSDTSVATVSAGSVTGVSPGSATITATGSDSGISASITVIVLPVISISISVSGGETIESGTVGDAGISGHSCNGIMIFTPGDLLTTSVSAKLNTDKPPLTSKEADVYIAVFTPGGNLFCINDSGSFHPMDFIAPMKRSWQLKDMPLAPIHVFPIDSSIPSGRYTWHAVLMSVDTSPAGDDGWLAHAQVEFEITEMGR